MLRQASTLPRLTPQAPFLHHCVISSSIPPTRVSPPLPPSQVQGTAEIIVDLAAVKAILEAKIPGVLAGKPVSELAEPWPEAV